MIDPSAVLRMPVRAGPNGAGRVLVDKERRVMEIFPECDGICPLLRIAGRRMDKNRIQKTGDRSEWRFLKPINKKGLPSR